MKKLTIIIGLIVCAYQIFSQTPCEFIPIITDPNPAYVQPTGSTFQTNTFVWWMNPVQPINKPSSTNIPTSVASPYYNSSPPLQFINQNPNSIPNFMPDYKPEDGWELIKQDLGYAYSSSATPAWAGTPITCGDNLDYSAYIILYNKYEAKLRVFAILPNQGSGIVQVKKVVKI